nr:hypothetical protein [Nocardia sp. CNY236]
MAKATDWPWKLAPWKTSRPLEEERVVVGGVQLGRHDAGGVVDGVAHRADDLRDGPQRVRLLQVDLSALDGDPLLLLLLNLAADLPVLQRQAAAGQQGAHVGRVVHLPSAQREPRATGHR